MNSKPLKGTLVVILGPTGSGKTDLSIELARRFGAPIISFDSRQVFKGMAIGTAQPTQEQLAAAPHYFIADREISSEYNCGIFEKEALALLDRLFMESPFVIAVGGSGLYIDALCYGLDDLPSDRKIRATLEDRLAENDLGTLATQLKDLDPEYYAVVDINNPARVIRALEVCLTTGKPYSSLRSGRDSDRDFKVIKIGVRVERSELYERIDRRVDAMLDSGLETEARTLYPHRGVNALNTVGYKELFGYFDGTTSREEAVELIKRNSRRYAKRQMTWFNRDATTAWFERDDIEAIEEYITTTASLKRTYMAADAE